MGVPKLANLTYAHNLVIKSTHECKVHGHMVPTFHTATILSYTVSLLHFSLGPVVHGKLEPYGPWTLHS